MGELPDPRAHSPAPATPADDLDFYAATPDPKRQPGTGQLLALSPCGCMRPLPRYLQEIKRARLFAKAATSTTSRRYAP